MVVELKKNLEKPDAVLRKGVLYSQSRGTLHRQESLPLRFLGESLKGNTVKWQKGDE